MLQSIHKQRPVVTHTHPYNGSLTFLPDSLKHRNGEIPCVFLSVCLLKVSATCWSTHCVSPRQYNKVPQQIGLKSKTPVRHRLFLTIVNAWKPYSIEEDSNIIIQKLSSSKNN